MGENQHDSPARIAKGLSSRMLGVLGTAADTRYGSQHVLGSAVTLKALKTRGLINEQHYLTDLGRRVAYAAGAKVMLLDELHAEANADPRQRAEQEDAQVGPTSRPIADGAGDFRRGESVIVAQGDGRVWQIDDLRETLGGERFATMTHTGRSPLDTSHTAVPLDRLRHATSQISDEPPCAPGRRLGHDHSIACGPMAAEESRDTPSRFADRIARVAAAAPSELRLWFRRHELLNFPAFHDARPWDERVFGALGVDHAEALRANALRPITATSRLTVKEFEDRISENPLDSLRDLDASLATRIVQRAQYDALRTVLRVLTGWIEGSRENCEALGHRGESREQACGQQFTPEDIRRMLDDAARELGVREPWAPEVTS